MASLLSNNCGVYICFFKYVLFEFLYVIILKLFTCKNTLSHFVGINYVLIFTNN